MILDGIFHHCHVEWSAAGDDTQWQSLDYYYYDDA